jgi:hypothetical protein
LPGSPGVMNPKPWSSLNDFHHGPRSALRWANGHSTGGTTLAPRSRGVVFGAPRALRRTAVGLASHGYSAVYNLLRNRPATVGSPVNKRLVTRYAMQSRDAADENQRRVEGVFAELAETKPDTVSYIVLRLADDSFVHISFHNHGDDEVNPIASSSAFAHFQDGHGSRREGPVDQQTAQLVGAYVTTIG